MESSYEFLMGLSLSLLNRVQWFRLLSYIPLMEVVGELCGKFFERPYGPWLQSIVPSPCCFRKVERESSTHDRVGVPIENLPVRQGTKVVDGIDGVSLSIVWRYLRRLQL